MTDPTSSLNPIANGNLPGHHVELGAEIPLRLDSGAFLGPFTIAFQTYGKLNADKSNAILVCHALTGDQYPAEQHPVTKKGGWWDLMIGSGKVIDTSRYFVICSNVLGGCMGTTGRAPLIPKVEDRTGWNSPLLLLAIWSERKPC